MVTPELASTTGELALDCRCWLAEGILWCPQRQLLFWTDIHASQLWMGRPSEDGTLSRADVRSWLLPDRLGCLAFTRSGSLLLGLAKGLYLFDVDANIDGVSDAPPLVALAPVEPAEPRTRINDGRCDRAGHFVFGTMNEDRMRDSIGSLYQFSRYGLRRLDLPGFAIPNSICFSLDGGTLYYSDTKHPHILCCDYDAPSATVRNARLFATLPSGCPDGSTIDAEGCLWNAQWGAARVVRYTPRGSEDHVVPVPAKHPTCVAFGGERLDTLFITTARDGLTSEELDACPQAGGIFRCVPGVRGVPECTVLLT